MHRLSAIISGKEEIILDQFEDFYDAIDAAENEHTDYVVFRICETNTPHCLVGTRNGLAREVYWRIPRESILKHSHRRIMDFLDKIILSHLKNGKDNEEG